jgi:hypothetical protein
MSGYGYRLTRSTWLRSWPSKRPRLQGLSLQPPQPTAIHWRCRSASFPPTRPAGNPKPQAQRNHRYAEACGYTDPDSHIFKGSAGWIQGYNCQAAVDGDHQVIVAIGVSNQASDAVHLIPMLERVEANTSQWPARLTADAGYCSTANIEESEQRGIDAYLSTSRQQHG